MTTIFVITVTKIISKKKVDERAMQHNWKTVGALCVDPYILYVTYVEDELKE